MKKSAVLSLVAGVAFLVASACFLITHFTGSKESSTWLILGCLFFVLAVPAIAAFSRSLKNKQ